MSGPNLKELGRELERWFGDGGASLTLPSGWVGRPWDELYWLSWWGARPERLLVELDTRTLLVLVEPRGLEFDGNSVGVVGCTQTLVSWRQSAKRVRAQIEDAGDVYFRRP